MILTKRFIYDIRDIVASAGQFDTVPARPIRPGSRIESRPGFEVPSPIDSRSRCLAVSVAASAAPAGYRQPAPGGNRYDFPCPARHAPSRVPVRVPAG
ncbi:hypothetical protein LSAT2_029270 [Lamellibrachia satsuma]|nr:hypothetical protein LSAT2_029270 [Lamellibrachia satsuma]